MSQKHTAPPQLQAAIEHWSVLTKDKDPIISAAARELVADLKQVSRPRQAPEDRTPASWTGVIDQVIDAEPRSSVTDHGYKTGHGHVHPSRSGTCVSVDTVLGRWYCSSPSCQRGGTTITWVMDIEQCSYGQAWQALVDRFGAEHA